LTDTVHFSVPKDRIVMLMDSRVPVQENNYPITIDKESWDYFVSQRNIAISLMLQSVKNVPLSFFSDSGYELKRISDNLTSLENIATEIKLESAKLTELAGHKDASAFLNQLSFVAEKFDWYITKYINITYQRSNFESRFTFLESPYTERYGKLPLTFSDLKIPISRGERDELNNAFSYAGIKLTNKIGNLDLTIGAGKALALAAALSSPLMVTSFFAGSGSLAVWGVAGGMFSLGALVSVASRWNENLGGAGLVKGVVSDLSGYTNYSLVAHRLDPVTGKSVELTNEELGAAIASGIVGLVFGIKGLVSGKEIAVNITSDMFNSFRPSSGGSLSYATGGLLTLTAESIALLPEFTIATPRPTMVTAAVVSVGPKQFILSMTASDGGGGTPPNKETPPGDGEPTNGEKKGTLEISDEGLITKEKEYKKFLRLLHTGKELAKRGYNVLVGGEAQNMAAEIMLKPGNGIEQLAPAESKLLNSPRANAVQSNLRESRKQENGSFVIIDGTASGCTLETFMEGFNRFVKLSIKPRKLAGQNISGRVLFLFGELQESWFIY